MHAIANAIRHPNLWGSLVIFLVALPLFVIFLSWISVDQSMWAHLRQHLLWSITWQSIILTGGVVLGTLVVGTSLAAFTTFFTFPGRRFLNWALILPFALPAYVLTFVWIEILDYSGPVQTLWRANTNTPFLGNLFQIRSIPGGIFTLTLAFYPYVYLLAKEAFLTQGKRALESSQVLGISRTKFFMKTAIPLARPWIAAGLILVAMETLSDFGSVSLLGIQTFTIGIFRTWYSLQSPITAAQIASFVVVLVFLLYWLEDRARKKQRFFNLTQNPQVPPATKPKHLKLWAVTGFSWSVFALAFAIPIFQLIRFSVLQDSIAWSGFAFDRSTINSLIIGLSCAALVTGGFFLLIISARVSKSRFLESALKIGTLGYALPGAVLAVGVFLPLVWVDHRLHDFFAHFFNLDVGLLLTGGILALIYGLSIRFASLAILSLKSSIERISPNVESAAQILGAGKWKLTSKIFYPAMKKGLIVSFLFVMVDVMKEMPLTLMTRPFGWDTLSVKIYELTSEGLWYEAAVPSLKLVVIGLIPTMILIQRLSKKRY